MSDEDLAAVSPLEARKCLRAGADKGALSSWRQNDPEIIRVLEEKAARANIYCLENIVIETLQNSDTTEALALERCKACCHFVGEYDGDPTTKATLLKLINACKSIPGRTPCKTVYSYSQYSLAKEKIEAKVKKLYSNQ